MSPQAEAMPGMRSMYKKGQEVLPMRNTYYGILVVLND